MSERFLLIFGLGDGYGSSYSTFLLVPMAYFPSPPLSSLKSSLLPFVPTGFLVFIQLSIPPGTLFPSPVNPSFRLFVVSMFLPPFLCDRFLLYRKHIPDSFPGLRFGYDCVVFFVDLLCFSFLTRPCPFDRTRSFCSFFSLHTPPLPA